MIEAGLPNITGNAQTTFATGHKTAGAGIRGMGAIRSSWFHSGNGGAHGDGALWTQIDIDASRSSPIYGRSETVQPPAYTVRYLIRALP